MVTVIATKASRYGKRTKVGDKMQVTQREATAMIALGLAEYPRAILTLKKPTPAVTPPAGQYMRRDMTAEKPKAR